MRIEKLNILFVCLGNICRSPMAEGLFLAHRRNAGLDDLIEVDSAGTSGWHVGELADPRMQETAKKHGVDLVSRSRKLVEADYQLFDYIIVMDKQNLRDAEDLMSLVNSPKAKVELIREYDDIDAGQDVPDPYFGGKQGFEHVYTMLDRSTKSFLDYLVQEHKLDS